ncbi:uncharacterized protein [Palaemon carinicauda]|uniref:uncharacterized protein n=1 Tax=Palaemon carinicauda TaxID=392227 RepID=UPI0035B68E7A
MINYHHRFLPAIATSFHLYASSKTKPRDLRCGPIPEVAFCNAMNALSITAGLSYHVPHAPLLLFTDASEVTIGAVHEKVLNGSTLPLDLFNRKLSKTESSYFTFDCKLLAVHLAVSDFPPFLGKNVLHHSQGSQASFS